MTEKPDASGKLRIPLSRKYRCFLYFIIITIECVMNVSNGIFSSASNEIKSQLKLANYEFGMFGSVLSTGRILSTLLFGVLNKVISLKWSTAGFVFVFALSSFGFFLSNNKFLLIGLRGIQGFSQMPPSVYVPIWINQYGISRYKTMKMTSIQLAQTSGKCIPYFINFVIGAENWKYGFLYSGLYLVFNSVCCAVSSNNYFSNSLYSTHSQSDDSEEVKCSIFEETEKKASDKKSNFFEDLKKLLVDKIFMINMLCRIVMHGLNTCLHYWLTDFIRNAVGEKNTLKITICYSVLCLMGPILGIAANEFLRRFIGSYEGRKASWPVVGIQTLASFAAVSISFMPDTYSAIGCAILYLLLNSTALPLVQGMLISCVAKDLSVTGFAITNILTQVLVSGSFPALYGYINDRTKDYNPRIAMRCTMGFQFVAIPLLAILAVWRNKRFDELEKSKEEGQELIEKN